MSTDKRGEAAFPLYGVSSIVQHGMTLRDYFAGKAVAGMLADLPKTMYGLDWERNVAFGAYRIADAMLEARATHTAAQAATDKSKE